MLHQLAIYISNFLQMRMLKSVLFSIFLLLSALLASPMVFSQAINGIISINNGASVTNAQDGKVNLKVFAKGAAEMMISNNGSFIGARWVPYEQAKANYKLDAREDGVKTVYAKFRDASKTII